MRFRGYIILLLAGAVIGALLMYLFAKNKSDDSQVRISHHMIVERIESMGNLEVLKYSIQDIVEYKKVRRWLPNAKTALMVSGEVICCVDLTKVKPDDIYTSRDSIRLRLPEPEICHVKIDHSQSRVYDLEYGLWESEQIMDEAYRFAEQEIKNQAQKLDISGKSRDNTVNLLKPLLQAMGFKQVSITFYSTHVLEK